MDVSLKLMHDREEAEDDVRVHAWVSADVWRINVAHGMDESEAYGGLLRSLRATRPRPSWEPDALLHFEQTVRKLVDFVTQMRAHGRSLERIRVTLARRAGREVVSY